MAKPGRYVGERGGGEELGVGCDAEAGTRVHRRWIAHPADTIALGQHDLAILDDGDRKAGDGKGLHDALDVVIEVGRRLLGRAGTRSRE
jgi:hypothetical protein